MVRVDVAISTCYHFLDFYIFIFYLFNDKIIEKWYHIYRNEIIQYNRMQLNSRLLGS